MQALKVVVIVMAALIAAGAVVVVVTVADRLSGGPEGGFAAELAIPKGCELAEATEAGDRLVLRLVGPGCRRVLLVDPATGDLLGRLDLVPVP